MKNCAQVLLGMAAALLAPSVLAADAEQEELLRLFGDEDFVSIATGFRQPITYAPSVASVITAEDIASLGATDLDQVLETVPGLHVSVSAAAYNPVYTIRGIHAGSDVNPQVLLLVNGIPQTNVFAGNRGQGWGGMPVRMIKRIEVIRGPGSAVYGADAFAGVINVITKSAEDIQSTEIGGLAGSFDTARAWLLSGGNLGMWRSTFGLEVHATHGHSKQITEDAQTGNDNGLGTSASLAPGPVNVGRKSLDARVDLRKDRWKARFGLQLRTDIETGAGGNQALDPEGKVDSHRFNTDLTYEDPNFSESWEIIAQASLFDVSVRSDLTLLPPGTDFALVGGGTFPDGVIGNPDVFERHWRLSTTGTYTGTPGHRIQVGGGYALSDMYKIKETKNFSLDPGAPPDSLGGVVDVTDTAPFIRPRDRGIWFTWVQDEWGLAPDWTLTTGLRYDNYSDFGGTINPRLALVWKTSLAWTTKFLYGRAFRAPSFAEQFNINNPVALGNPDLEPETIDTLEVAFDYRPHPDFHTSFNVFAYKWEDIIRFVPDAAATTSTAQNTGEQDGYGFEYELVWKVAHDLSLRGNFAWQRSKDRTNDTDAGYAPGHQLYLRGDWRIAPDWDLNTQVNFVADRARSAGDTRPPIDDYTTVDLTLRSAATKGWGMAIIARNILDEDAREPSLAPGSIPNDLPLAGRSVAVEIEFPL